MSEAENSSTAMAPTSAAAAVAPPFSTDLQECFSELKRHSLSYKMSSNLQDEEFGDNNGHNPLNKQFSILLTKINELLNQTYDNNEDYLKILIMKGSVLYEKAKLLLGENHLDISKKELEEALDLIRNNRKNPKVSFLYLRLVNHYTYVLCRQGEMEMAKKMLLEAIEDSKDCEPVVFSTDDLFFDTKKDPKFSKTKLNRLMINNMQMLSWTYMKLNETKKNLQIQHDILQKQIETDECEIFKWIDCCCQLAIGFIGELEWVNARYHLSAAECVINRIPVSNTTNNNELFAIQAELSRTWIYYGLQLLKVSRKTIFEKNPTEMSQIPETSKPAECSMTFNGLEIDLAPMPTQIIKTANESKTLFSSMQKWFKRARLYYTLRDYPLQYVNVCLDMAEYYRYMSLYETDIESQYQLQKKRYDSLESLGALLREVRPNCYMSVNVELIKETIETQMDLMQLNLRKFCMPTQPVETELEGKVCGRQLEAFSSIYKKLGAVAAPLNDNIRSLELTVPTRNQQEKEILEQDDHEKMTE